MRARTAIYGFAEAARLFWLALRDVFIEDGWVQSKLECALFFHWDDEGELQGIAGTHVDDVLAGLRPDFEEAAFTKVKQRFRFGKWEKDDFIFRGREWKRGPNGEGLITMRSYARGLIKYVEAPEGLEDAVGKRAYRCGEDFAEAGHW